MKSKKIFIFLFLISSLFTSIQAYSQDSTITLAKSKRASFEFQIGSSSLVGNGVEEAVNPDFLTGYCISIKYEYKKQKKFSYFFNLNYSSYPSFDYFDDYKVKNTYVLTITEITGGGKMYFPNNNALNGLLFYLGGELGFLFGKYTNTNKESYSMDTPTIDYVVAPILGITYPISNDFILSSQLKYRLNPLGSFLNVQDFRAINLNIGIAYIFNL